MCFFDEDDLFEIGIEIVVCLLGKKLQNIMLMSGGEKVFIVIVLFFVFFQMKLLLFCIFDEVDVLFDDVNVLCFVDMFKVMLEDIQFFVVMYNKLMMEVVSLFYGVIMEEKGVFKFVGVDVDELYLEDVF